MQRLAWVKRRFQLGLPEGWLPNILGRLEGTSIRLAYYSSLVNEEQASKKLDGKWSIKEEIGHLVDLEDLHISRVEDFANRIAILGAADMSNKKTEAANHNTRSLEELLEAFRQKRQVFLEKISVLPKESYSFEALHPRLKVKMKPVDLAYFTAEHDDHHICSILEIINQRLK